MFKIFVNVIGSGRPQFNLPAYVDFGVKGSINWPKDGSVHRIHLPRKIFRKTHLIKIEVK